MANIGFQYNLASLTPGANPYTFCQFKMATNTRCKLIGIRFMPSGSTGASVPVTYDVGTDTVEASTGFSADNSNLVKNHPQGSEALQTTVKKNTTGGGSGNEPAGTRTPFHQISLHQQGTEMWYPPGGPILMMGASLWFIRQTSGLFIPTPMTVYLEE